jgi:hypothetical protein
MFAKNAKSWAVDRSHIHTVRAISDTRHENAFKPKNALAPRKRVLVCHWVVNAVTGKLECHWQSGDLNRELGDAQLWTGSRRAPAHSTDGRVIAWAQVRAGRRQAARV